MEKNLLPYQIEHTKNMIKIIKKNKTCLDASDTGTGKTYCAIALCKELKLQPFIICPKSVIFTWKKVCQFFDVKPFVIVNYEAIKTGKYYENGERVECPYIKVNNNLDEKFIWNIHNEKIIFIFDEGHKCNDIKTLNGKLLYTAKNLNKELLVLSATIADHYENFKIFYYVLNFIEPEHVIKHKINYNKYQYIINKWISRDAKPLWRIHQMLFPDRGSRIRIDALGDMFPETQIIAIPYNIEKKRQQEIEKEYSVIKKEIEIVKSKKTKVNILTTLLRSHQKIELLKIPLFISLANDYLENNYSVVIFVNFTQTLLTLAKELYTNCIIYGDQTEDQRNKNIELFQQNKSKIIICNIKAGGTGISLHDINGNHPRVSLISPTWSSIELQQAFGRIHRAGSKSKSLQRIVYVSETIEENIAEKLQAKLLNINTINNGDLDFTNIDYQKDRIVF